MTLLFCLSLILLRSCFSEQEPFYVDYPEEMSQAQIGDLFQVTDVSNDTIHLEYFYNENGNFSTTYYDGEILYPDYVCDDTVVVTNAIVLTLEVRDCEGSDGAISDVLKDNTVKVDSRYLDEITHLVENGTDYVYAEVQVARRHGYISKK